jgi:hypothetical protein
MLELARYDATETESSQKEVKTGLHRVKEKLQ